MSDDTLVPVAPASPETLVKYVAPVLTAEAAREASREFGRLKAALVTESDCIYQVGERIYTRRADAEHAAVGAPFKAILKKSGVLKLAQAFGITTELVSESWAPDGEWVDMIVRAIHPSGISSEGIASCERWEKGKGMSRRGKEKKPLTRHTMRGTAFTRAANRAILALIGGGEVSAEELTAGGELDAVEYIDATFGQPAQPVEHDVPRLKEPVRDPVVPKPVEVDYTQQPDAAQPKPRRKLRRRRFEEK